MPNLISPVASFVQSLHYKVFPAEKASQCWMSFQGPRNLGGKHMMPLSGCVLCGFLSPPPASSTPAPHLPEPPAAPLRYRSNASFPLCQRPPRPRHHRPPPYIVQRQRDRYLIVRASPTSNATANAMFNPASNFSPRPAFGSVSTRPDWYTS